MSSDQIDLVIKAHQAWLTHTANSVEFLRAYLARDLGLSEFARVMKCAFDGRKNPPSVPVIHPTDDIALRDRLQALTEGWFSLLSAANASTLRMQRTLGIIEKFGDRYGRLIVRALNLLDSFFWPGRGQWLHDRFQDCCSRQQNLLDAFRRDYLQQNEP